MKLFVYIYVLIVNLFEKSEVRYEMQVIIADCDDMLNILCPLRSSSTPLYLHTVRLDYKSAHRKKEIERRRAEYTIWRENNRALWGVAS